MKVPGISLADVRVSTGTSGDEMALVLQDSNLVLRELSNILTIDLNLPKVIAQCNIPFLIMPGDGAANGCLFTGTNGAFTLSAAINANIGPSLAGCYAYFSANFGGSSLPAGWYWTEFSSDTAGIVYADTYTTGKPTRIATKTAIATNLSGWVTATTSEIIGLTGFLCAGTALGKNGCLSVYLRQAGSIIGNKTFRTGIGSTTASVTGSTTGPTAETLQYISCIDSSTSKFVGRVAANGTGGVASLSGGYGAAQIISVDTSVDTNLYVSLQGSTNLAAPVLLTALITAQYGE